MSYISKDEQLLYKIRKYKNKLVKLYNCIKDMSDKDIDDGTDGLALAQCLTNLYELGIRLTNNKVSQKLNILISKDIQVSKDIASYDYDVINWSILKRNTFKIINSLTKDCIDECFKDIEKYKLFTKDYTQLTIFDK